MKKSIRYADLFGRNLIFISVALKEWCYFQNLYWKEITKYLMKRTNNDKLTMAYKAKVSRLILEGS